MDSLPKSNSEQAFNRLKNEPEAAGELRENMPFSILFLIVMRVCCVTNSIGYRGSRHPHEIFPW